MAGTSPLEEPPGYYAKLNPRLVPVMFTRNHRKQKTRLALTRDVATSASLSRTRMEYAYEREHRISDLLHPIFLTNLVEIYVFKC